MRTEISSIKQWLACASFDPHNRDRSNFQSWIFLLLMEFDEPDPSCWDRPQLEGYPVYIYDLILFIYLFFGEVLGDLPYDNIGPFICFSLGDIYLEKR